jgi:hypothetical protein
LVTDKNHARVSFGFDQLDTQLRRLEQLLVYCDDSKQELATVNLLVQRNIPVTFAKPASEVINDTIDPDEQPLVMKALPVKPPKPAASPARKPTHTSSPSIKRAIPIEKGKRKANG